ncbi:chromosome segregation protein SMC [Aeromonas hydrophila]|uniref:AAA family ATPase n=1 Tax=Aeromonas TaxID=642 RepID=UPI00101B1948|nr:AAA family ATPase [Aeromonas hydrophila]BBG83444.1 chromosome segregation protein SMC [Aeromonas hydrophila]BBT60785.1 chromosome segregation protein SMC [Aeromonas hydrophila]
MANLDKALLKKVPARIQSVTIEGFRSLRHIDRLELPQLTVLIGANGAGKSTLIRFFEMLSWMLKSQNLQEFVLRHGGGDDQFFMGARKTARIHAELCLDTGSGMNDYRFDLMHLSAGDTLMVSNEAYRFAPRRLSREASWTELSTVGKESCLPEQKNKTAKTICSLLRQCQTYQFHDTSVNSSIRLRWDISESYRLRSDGGNLAAVLLDLQANDPLRYKVIVRQIQRVLPTFKTFVLEPVAGKVELRWQGLHSDKIFGAHLTSDGSLRLFCLLTLLNLPPERLPDVMFFDEPELGLHPHAITLVAEMLKRLAKSRQIFVATQSPYMVDCFDLENIIVAESKQGETSLRNLPREQYQSWLDDDYLLSDIWLTTPVGGL